MNAMLVAADLKWIITMKYPEESSHWEDMIFPEVIPLPPSSTALLAARHNPHSGTDRLTNKVNKYFPPLLKANQILILEVWSAEKKQQTIGRGELIELIHSRNALGRRRAREGAGQDVALELSEFISGWEWPNIWI